MLDFGYYNMDCMEGMKEFPDKYFDLAIVDPPYGGGGTQSDKAGLTGGAQTMSADTAADSADGLTSIISAQRTGGKWAKRYQTNGGIFEHDIRHWDVAPGEEYFKELARVSKNQIIWGANYFDMPPTRCFIVWRKTNIPAKGFTMAPVEYAWTSFNANAEYIEFGSAGGDRIHPTQKPVDLYIALLNAHAKPGFKILDTHVGSASSLIACYRMGFQYVGFELDKTYYELSTKRIADEMSQIRFDI